MNAQPSYYAIIPATVRYDSRICPNAKLLFGELTALCSASGFCWASNQYFASLYGVSKETVSRWISQLNKSGHIKIQFVAVTGNTESWERKIFIATPIDEIVTPHDEKINTPCGKDQDPMTKRSRPHDEKIKHNITCNTTSNNTLNKESEIEKSELDPEIQRLTQLLYDQLCINCKPAMWDKVPPKLSTWYPHIEKMHRIDKMSVEEIERVIMWVARDNFWQRNIRSGEKLRAQNLKHDFLGQSKSPRRTGYQRPGIGFNPDDPDQQAAMERLRNL